MIYVALSALTRAMVAVRINHVKHIVYCKRQFVCKSRRLGSEMIIFSANCFFFTLGVKTRFLKRSTWEHRERDMYRLLYDEDVYVDRHRVYIPYRKGESLNDYLRNPQQTIQGKFIAVQASIQALIRFHLTVLPFDDQSRMVSHGDTTAFNVIYNERLQSAQWIDFETVHDLRHPSVIRHAEDLKTFVFSVLSCMEEGHWDDLIYLLVQEYSELIVWAHVLDSIRYRRRRCIFTMAQTRMGLNQYRQIRNYLMNSAIVHSTLKQVQK